MGSSAKKKKEKAKDFAKPKLKVGKARPKNTNATDTSFSAKSIVLKQQSLSESGRDAGALFHHNLSLLSSRNETQRRDALHYLTSAAAAATQNQERLPQPASVVIAKAQPLILDGSRAVREQLVKLLKMLPTAELGPAHQILLYTRAGLAHLSTDIRLSSLDVLDWLLSAQPEATITCPGGWVKTLRTFQSLLGWHHHTAASAPTDVTGANGTWSAAKPAPSLGGSDKLLVHQLATLARFLAAGLARPPVDPAAATRRAAASFPLWHADAHLAPRKGNPFAALNLFGAPRDVEGEVYLDAEERAAVFHDTGMYDSFLAGVAEAKKEGGEVGRAASKVGKALGLAQGG